MPTVNRLMRSRALSLSCIRFLYNPRNIAVLLTLLSFALRLWRIDAQSLWWDESLSLYRAQQNIPFILSNHIDFPGVSTTDQHPPLYFLLLHVLTRTSGESDFVLRFLSLIFATLLVPLLYAFGVRLGNQRAGLFAGMIGTLSPFYLWYAQEVRMYAMIAFLGLMSLYALWRFCIDRKVNWLIIYISATIFAIFTHYLFVLVLASEAFILVILLSRPGDIQAQPQTPPKRHYYLLILAAALVSAFVVWVLFKQQINTLFGTLNTGLRRASLATILWDGLNSFSLGLSVSLSRVRAIDLAFLAIFLIGVARLWARPPIWSDNPHPSAKKRLRWAVFILLIGAIFFTVLIIWLISFYTPIYKNSRYLAMVSAPFYLGLSMGLEAIASWKGKIASAITVFLILSMLLSTYRYFYDENYRKEDYRGAAYSVMNSERIGDVIVVNGAENLTAFLHYYQGPTPVLALPKVGSDEATVSQEMRRLAEAYDRIWLVLGRTEISDPQQRVANWLDENTMTLSRSVYTSMGHVVKLRSFLTRSPIRPLDTSVTPIGVLQDRLALLDYTLRYADTTGRPLAIVANLENRYWEQRTDAIAQSGIVAGSSVSVILNWEPLEALGRYQMSLRLVDHTQCWAQHDSEPYISLPTTLWPVGSVVRHETDLRIPPGAPPGVYHLQLWVYEPETERPLSFRDSQTGWEQPYIELGQVTISKPQQPISIAAWVSGVNRLTRKTVFGSDLEILGYHVGPEMIKPGDSLTLDVYWRARRAITEDYVLVINWEDATGRVWHSGEQAMTREDYPTSSWSAGEIVWGRPAIVVPPQAPAGVHRIHLLVKTRQDGRLLWLRRGIIPWSGRNLLLAEITVQ